MDGVRIQARPRAWSRWPAGIRKALIIRDRHYRYPGCDIPGVWRHAHHLTHWARGGPTAPSNLVLLCHHPPRRPHRPRPLTTAP